MERRKFVAAAGSGLAVGLAGCLGSSSPAIDDYDVGMAMHDFRPEELTVEAGTTVVWRNTSSHAHTVTAFEDGIPDDAEYFASGGYDDRATAETAWDAESGGALDQGDVFEYTFDIPGTYDYYCIPHIRADMLGTVEVTDR